MGGDWLEAIAALVEHARIDRLPAPQVVVWAHGVLTVSVITDADAAAWECSLADRVDLAAFVAGSPVVMGRIDGGHLVKLIQVSGAVEPIGVSA